MLMKKYNPAHKNSEYTTKEIAKALGLTEQQVLKAERSALKKLAVWLNGIEE